MAEAAFQPLPKVLDAIMADTRAISWLLKPCSICRSVS